MKRFLLSIFIFIFFCGVCYAEGEDSGDELPDTATLSANRMRFDAQTGDFLADGNVTIKAGELRVVAPVGSGNVDRREINFEEGITASGKWMGETVDIQAGKLFLSFADVPTCSFRDGVKGGIGTVRLDAERLTLIGTGGISEPTFEDRQTKFYLSMIRNLEDSSRGLSFGAESLEGIIRMGELYDLTAKKNVWLKGKPKAKGDAVSLRGDNALYSFERGSVVVSGHVVAVQGGRTLKSDSIVYFPDQNRVEALGGLTRNANGTVSADRAEITIDLSRERKPSTKTDTHTTETKPDSQQTKEIKIPTKPTGKTTTRRSGRK